MTGRAARTVYVCPSCGHTHRTVQPTTCTLLRRYEHAQPTELDALPPGHWAGGLTKRFIPDGETA